MNCQNVDCYKILVCYHPKKGKRREHWLQLLNAITRLLLEHTTESTTIITYVVQQQGLIQVLRKVGGGGSNIFDVAM